MKFVLKSIATVLIFCVCLSWISFKSNKVLADNEKCFTYLILGLDDAAQNADVIMLLSYIPCENRVSFVQIPRDTYLEIGYSQNKINQIYSYYSNRGFDNSEAMCRAANCISQCLGISLDGYIGVTTEMFRSAIDSIGGVIVTIPENFECSLINRDLGLSLKEGDNLLCGSEAEMFVRYREGYALGDLGRVDAQKLFVSGFLRTIKERAGYSELINVFGVLIKKGIITNLSFGDLISTLLIRKSDSENFAVYYVTAPGSALLDKTGIWCYVFNKKAMEKVISRHVSIEDLRFDTELKFTKKDDSDFLKIYYDENFSYYEYTDEALFDINIIRE